MKTMIRSALLGGLTLVAWPAAADHVCTNSPDEVFVAMTPAAPGQAPMPICRWSPENEGTQRGAATAPGPALIERWHVYDDRYSAFALDEAGAGPFGFVSGYETQAEADAAAISVCRERTGRGCQVVAQFKNRCATFAWGAGRYSVNGGATTEESEQKAVDACSKDAGVQCEVIESVCSKPVHRVVYEEPDDFVEDTSRSR